MSGLARRVRQKPATQAKVKLPLSSHSSSGSAASRSTMADHSPCPASGFPHFHAVGQSEDRNGPDDTTTSSLRQHPAIGRWPLNGGIPQKVILLVRTHELAAIFITHPIDCRNRIAVT